jgi:hypothetical protein
MRRKMRRSRSVRIGLLSSIAVSCVALGGCTRPQQSAESWDPVCVDKSNVVSSSQKCAEEEKTKSMNPGYIPTHSWYYMHSRPGMMGYYPIGSSVSGGTFSRPATVSHSGVSNSHSSTVTRGGFGATGAGHSASS